MHRVGVAVPPEGPVTGPGTGVHPEVGSDAAGSGQAARAAWAMAATTAVAGAATVALVGEPGDVTATAVYASLLCAATAAVVHRQHRATAGAVDAERRRIARNLHDGLAQELAYIRMETSRMAAMTPSRRMARVALAAQRALEESRGAIASLHGDEESFSAELSSVANDLVTREGAELSLNVDPDLELRCEAREALMRVMREAISNGVRHGAATELVVELRAGDRVRMAVRDNGTGFVPGGPRRRGSFGLNSMRERVEALGGDLSVSSKPGEGTVVEVMLP
jgi:signal transduction histidine kinase